MSVLAVVGMKREARIVSGPRARVAIGGDGSHLVRRIEAALDEGVRGVISIGIAGALSPTLTIGDCVIAHAVIGSGEQFLCDAEWSARLLQLLPGAKTGAILGVRVPAAGAQAKAALRVTSGADAVDMESDIAGRAAAAHGLPFAVLRVISDTASDALPPATAAALDPDGGVNLQAVLASVLRRPSQIPAVIRTGRNASEAFAALLRCHDLLGVGLGCPYLG